MTSSLREAEGHSEDGQSARLLVIADRDLGNALTDGSIEDLGLRVASASSPERAQSQIIDQEHDVILSGLTLNGASTLPLIKLALEASNAPKVIIVAKNDQVNLAAEAMRAGAFECLFVPFTSNRLERMVKSAMTGRPPRAKAALGSDGTPQHIRLDRNPPESFDPDSRNDGDQNMILSDISVQPVLQALHKVSASTASVFITGETGTGKALLAQAIHDASGRGGDKFFVVDCATLQSETFISDFFGHLAGAFPGASSDKVGLLEQADGGTVFLQGINNANMDVQKQLVRVLGNNEIRPLGDAQTKTLDVRYIASCNEDPFEEKAAGRLRRDLFYRLNVIPITLPPLRDRDGDIMEIAQAKMKEISAIKGKHFDRISLTAEMTLRDYHWPGNIRQLINTIRNVIIQNDGPAIEGHMLPAQVRDAVTAQAIAPKPDEPHSSLPEMLGRSLAEIERYFIEETIRNEDGSVPRAARVLGVSPSTIYRKREGWDPN